MSARVVSKRHGASHGSTSQQSTDLPAYQPPSFPLDQQACRALAELSSSRANDTAGLRRHLQKATQLLGGTVADLNDAVAESRDRLKQVSQSRRLQDGDPAMVETRDRLAAHVAQLEREAQTLNLEMEQSARELIDWTAAVEDEGAVMDAVRDALEGQAAAGRRRRRRRERNSRQGDDEDTAESEQQDEDTTTPPPNTMQMIRERREQKKAEYDAMTAHQRYALNNNYISFKKQQHESMFGDQEPLPDAKRWFTAEGRPVLGKKRRVAQDEEDDAGQEEGASERDGDGEDDDDDDDDDDLVIQSEKISLRCPLSLKDMEEPYSSTKCKHTFEKESIVAFIGQKREVRCPQAGCNMMLKLSDFYPDEAMLRKIKRAREAERRRPRDDDQDDPDAHASIAVSEERTVNVKQERRRGRPAVMDE